MTAGKRTLAAGADIAACYLGKPALQAEEAESQHSAAPGVAASCCVRSRSILLRLLRRLLSADGNRKSRMTVPTSGEAFLNFGMAVPTSGEAFLNFGMTVPTSGEAFLNFGMAFPTSGEAFLNFGIIFSAIRHRTMR